MGAPLKLISLLTIWGPPRFNFFAYYMGLPRMSFFAFYMGPPQVSFFVYYMGAPPPQVSFFAYCMGAPLRSCFFAYYVGAPLDKLLCILYGGPLKLVSLLTIGDPLISVSSLTKWGALSSVSSLNFFNIFFFNFTRLNKRSCGGPYIFEFPGGGGKCPFLPPPPAGAHGPQSHIFLR